MKERPELAEGLRRAYVRVLTPLASVAPLPLFWTSGASPLAVAVYESALLLLWWRARSGNPVRLSDAVLNVIGLCYLFWLAFEISTLRRGLLLSVSHLLLLTAIAKIASLKRPGEARTALLVLFLLTLASASSSTHVASLLYFVAMAFLAFRALGRLAALADFDEAPPDRVIASIPTAGLSAVAVVAALLLAVPLFYALPRLRNPFAVAPIRIDDALSTTLAADRVDLESFGAAKRSDRVVFRMDVEPFTALPRVLRLREAVFTEYHLGVWLRNSFGRGVRSPRGGLPDGLPREGPGRPAFARLSIDLNPFANGFLFLPYGASRLELDRGFPATLPDGVVQLAPGRRSVHYAVDAAAGEPRGIGLSAIDPTSVPPEIRQYAAALTGDLSDPAAISERIRDHFARDFVYTLDAPRGSGDPLVNFLLRSKSGHCEFFASAAAMMLTARGIPARLVTGSYGGELGFLSRALVVRGGNLHAWVEADIDGKGFSVLDPTPPAGIPPDTSRVSFWKRLATLGREIEFFYDRRILGFDS
ncbi:MAG TPA: transglutaminaseTgpA domain-containing protein, partial [Thermoanaerobaculia bacterium]|nr:transglutaminaseTgpA domain-containing protein [Thermoanaerobaculia bacterium]